MQRQSHTNRIIRLAMVPLLAVAVGAGAARAHDHGNPHDQGQHGNPHAEGQHGNPHDQQNNRGNDFHFRDQDRNQFQSHYQADANRWRNRPNRPHFERGQRIPNNYRFQPVPSSYYRGAPPPPPGYRYGYYDGYVVAYNPTTRVIGDVLDLVTAFTR